jgi:soluble lytic murein transglycosylase-like protein
VNKPEKVLGITLLFGLVAGIAYWIYLYISSGAAPSFSDLWNSASGAVSSATGLGVLSQSDVMNYAQTAGFSGDDLNTAVAIAQAESSFNPNAVGDLNITPGGSIGLWQVNLKAHPEYTAAQLQDAQTNANAAYAIYQAAGNAFSPWTTYNTGAYAKYLPSAPASDTTGATTAATGSAATATGVPDSTAYGASNDEIGGTTPSSTGA